MKQKYVKADMVRDDMVCDEGIIEEFDLVIYPLKLVVVIGELETAVNHFYIPRDRQYNWLAPPRESAAATVSLIEERESGKYGLMIWFSTVDDCTGSHICHECGHIALEIFKHIGAKLNYEDQEPFCYLLAAIFECSNETLYKYKDYIESKKSKNKTKKK